jgi:hypothetical protein
MTGTRPQAEQETWSRCGTVIPRFTSFRLHEMHKLIPVFKFTSQFSLMRDPSSRSPIIVVPSASSREVGKLVFVLRAFALRTVLEERIKLVNRVMLVYHERESYLWSSSPVRCV